MTEGDGEDCSWLLYLHQYGCGFVEEHKYEEHEGWIVWARGLDRTQKSKEYIEVLKHKPWRRIWNSSQPL